MKHTIFYVSGFSGVGKNEFCNGLGEATQVGLADSAKRHMMDIYSFTEEQLFGPSSARNAGDIRYQKSILNLMKQIAKRPISGWPNGSEYDDYDYEIRDIGSANGGGYGTEIHHAVETALSDMYEMSNKTSDIIRLGRDVHVLPSGRSVCSSDRNFMFKTGNPIMWLSPREALQKYMGLMCDLYNNTWIHKAHETHLTVANGHSYSKVKGLLNEFRASSPIISYSADIRHWNEISYIKENKSDGVKCVLVRIVSDKVNKPPYNHRSETEQATIPDSEFDFIVSNNGTIEDLHAKAQHISFMCKNDNHDGTKSF